MRKIILLICICLSCFDCFGNFVRIIFDFDSDGITNYRVYYGSNPDAKTNVVILPIRHFSGTSLVWDSNSCESSPHQLSNYDYLLVEPWPDGVPFYYGVENIEFNPDGQHIFLFSTCAFYPPLREDTRPTKLRIIKNEN